MQFLYFITSASTIIVLKAQKKKWNIAFIQKPKCQYTIPFLPTQLLTE